MRRLVALTSALALLTGCAAGSVAAPPPTLTVVLADDWESAPTVRQVVRDFEREHGVRVQVQAAPFSQIPDLVRNAHDLGDPFDLAHWHAFAAAADGLAEPLDDRWRDAGLQPSDYLPGAVDDVTWEGTRYGVPLDVNALVLLANSNALRASGLAPEDLADADRFLDAARTIRATEGVEHAITVSSSTWIAYGWIRAFGGDLLARDAAGTVTFTFDDPRVVAAVELLGALASEGVGTPPFAPDLSLDAIQSLTAGSVALHATGSWDLPLTRRVPDPSIGDDLLVLPLPRGEGDTGTVLGGSSLFVPRGAELPDLAFAFALALTAADVGRTLAADEGRLPARVAVYDDPLFREQPDLAAFVAELPEADVMPLIAYPELSAAFSATLERVLKGQQDASERARRAAGPGGADRPVTSAGRSWLARSLVLKLFGAFVAVLGVGQPRHAPGLESTLTRSEIEDRDPGAHRRAGAGLPQPAPRRGGRHRPEPVGVRAAGHRSHRQRPGAAGHHQPRPPGGTLQPRRGVRSRHRAAAAGAAAARAGVSAAGHRPGPGGGPDLPARPATGGPARGHRRRPSGWGWSTRCRSPTERSTSVLVVGQRARRAVRARRSRPRRCRRRRAGRRRARGRLDASRASGRRRSRRRRCDGAGRAPIRPTGTDWSSTCRSRPTTRGGRPATSDCSSTTRWRRSMRGCAGTGR